MKRYVYTSLAMLGGVILGYLVGSVILGLIVACLMWVGIFDASILTDNTTIYVTGFGSLIIGVAFAWYFFGKKVWRKYAPSVSEATIKDAHT